MKTYHPFPASLSSTRLNSRVSTPRGFALIATISVMVLLVMIALAMLSLSTIELRSSRSGSAQEEAKANARMALMIALGELQKQAGPDQRVTATGGITGEDAAHRHIAGVWNSWSLASDSDGVNPFDPFSPPTNYQSTKDAQFRRWLVSHDVPSDVESVGFAKNGNFSKRIEMLGEGTLGDAADADDYVYAGKVPVVGSSGGNMAWVVMDDGVKARVDLPLKLNEGSIAERGSNLGAANRTALEGVITEYDPKTMDPQKFISLKQAQLEVGVDMGKYTHDLTVWSQGPMTNVVEGGLREDLNLIADGASLPSKYDGRRIYSGTAEGVTESDPYWQQIFDYASLYKSMSEVDGTPEVALKIPEGYKAARKGRTGKPYSVYKDPPRGMLLVPVVAKVQIVFSLVLRKAHGWYFGQIKPNMAMADEKIHFVHMMYSPVVTLYNPYNVAMKFDRLHLQFANVPIGFQFLRNGQEQSTELVPFNWMFDESKKGENFVKSFGMTVQDSDGSGAPQMGLTLLPGEVKVFSTYLPTGLSWNNNRGKFEDWKGKLTGNVEATPGWDGDGIGYSTDFLTPPAFMNAANDEDKRGVFAVGKSDSIGVKFGPKVSDAAANGSMQIIITHLKGADKTEEICSVIEMKYGDSAGLEEMLSDSKYTYPTPQEGTLYGSDIFEEQSTLIEDYVRVKPFCMFSIYGKTSFGGTDGNADGLYKTKAWSFVNPVSNVSVADLVGGHPAHFPYEFNIEPLHGTVSSTIGLDSENRGRYISGHTPLHGLKFGTHNELPIAPILSVSNLQSANLCSSGYLPKFDYPVANSYAHPLMAPSGAKSVRNGDMLDHSYLLNHYLYDRYYCSTVADYRGAMFDGSGRSTKAVLKGFLDGDNPLLDRRFIAWTSGKQTSTILNDIVGIGASEDGYRKIAAYQMLRGQWNVNSVSKEAWKAVLGGMNHADFPIFDALTSSFLTKTDVSNPMSRYNLPNGGGVETTGSSRQDRWTGYRELSEEELDALATEIVEEVRARGPFLSLSEFVNRRLSGSTEETISGALQAAIDKTDLNEMFEDDGHEITNNDVQDYDYQNADAAMGSSSQGAPGSISQGHIMNALGNAATVRSNTFTIRAYGESLDGNGKVLARAWCEAVVQRVPDYLDDSDLIEAKPSELSSEANKNFGRRIRVVTFRWLGKSSV